MDLLTRKTLEYEVVVEPQIALDVGGYLRTGYFQGFDLMANLPKKKQTTR